MMTNLGLKTTNCDYSASHSSNYSLQVSTRTGNGALIVHTDNADTILGLVVHRI